MQTKTFKMDCKQHKYTKPSYYYFIYKLCFKYVSWYIYVSCPSMWRNAGRRKANVFPVPVCWKKNKMTKHKQNVAQRHIIVSLGLKNIMTAEKWLKRYLTLQKQQFNGKSLPIKCCAKNKIFSLLWHIVLKNNYTSIKQSLTNNWMRTSPCFHYWDTF